MATCPTVPHLPEDVKGRFASMRGYDIRMSSYGTLLCQQIQTITVDLTGIQTQIADHETRITDLESDVVTINNTLSTLTTSSSFTMPDHLIQENLIDGGETFIVPAQWNMVNAGAYTVAGTLIVHGTAAFL